MRNSPRRSLSEDGEREHREETKLKATGDPPSNRRTNSDRVSHGTQAATRAVSKPNRHGLTVEALAALVGDDKTVAAVGSSPSGELTKPAVAGRDPPLRPKSLADHVPSAAHWKNGKNGKGREQNRLGVTQKGVWAMYPKYEGTAKKEIGDST